MPDNQIIYVKKGTAIDDEGSDAAADQLDLTDT